MKEVELEAVPCLLSEVQPILEQLERGEAVEGDALMVACQNLVTWASRFDSTRHGLDTVEPSQAESEEAVAALLSLSQLISAYEHAMSGIESELAQNHHHRRAMTGYGCVKSVATHSQFVNHKI